MRRWLVTGGWWLAAAGVTLSSQAAPQRPGLPPLPLTQLDDRAAAAELDNRAFTLTFAQPVPIRDLLLLLVRGTSLSIVPDPSIEGTFIGELKNVTVRQALNLILPQLGLASDLDGTFVRVFKREPETRLFDVNYAATDRTGATTVTAAAGGSSATVSTTTKTDAFGDLASGVRSLLSPRATFSLDRKAGLLQVTDFPERLDRVAIYLDAVQDRVHRQVQIDARVIEVEPFDADAPGVDWTVVASQMVGAQPQAPGAVPRPSLTGLRVTDLTKLLALLAAQGQVATVAVPRLLTLNNEPALVSTEAIALSVTPQVAVDGVVTLSVSPIVKTPAPGQADLIARVAGGETLVLSGFTRTREVREQKHSGTSGGWFGRSTTVTQKHVEMVILLTPRIVTGVGVQ
jgi:type II secretory pathway component GspD/PulD (secretin)